MAGLKPCTTSFSWGSHNLQELTKSLRSPRPARCRQTPRVTSYKPSLDRHSVGPKVLAHLHSSNGLNSCWIAWSQVVDVFSQLMEWPQVYKGSKGSEETRGTPLNRLEITRWPLQTFWKSWSGRIIRHSWVGSSEPTWFSNLAITV